MNSQVILIIAAIATVYIVLGILYESYVHPLTILSTLPSAGVGALLALELFNAPFSLIALIGIMLLIGIVKKNAIMMVDFALEAQRHGNLTPQEAIFQACLLRFRPIMMTTLAALFGALPLALSGGDGWSCGNPGDRRCRRTGNEPAPYAVYHAGGVSLFRPSAAAFFA